MTDFITTPAGRRIAYEQSFGQGTGIMFLGGFKSDMTGTKATFLQDWAKAQNRPFVRFDYSGHGASSGDFSEGCIGDWADDAKAVLETLTQGPQILVGSSMGGWIALLLARTLPQRVAGFVGIAAAPDFTVDMLAKMSDGQKAELAQGQVTIPSGYEEPYLITRRLIEDGARRQIFTQPLALPIMRILQGSADYDVPDGTALRLLNHVTCRDAQFLLVKGADHSFSTPLCLSLITDAIMDIAPS